MSNCIVKTADEVLYLDEKSARDLYDKSNVLIALNPTDDKVDLTLVKKFGEAFDHDGTIFAYEEPGGKGGGADFLPSLSDTVFYSIAIVVLKSAYTFTEEISKDIYKEYLRPLIMKKKNSPHEDGKLVLKLTTTKKVTITYIFQKYLTDSEFFDALKLVSTHFQKIEKNNEEIKHYDFIFDRKDNMWLPL